MLLLTQKRALDLLRYDAETGRLYWIQRYGKEAGWENRGYRMVKVDGQELKVHRVIWLMVYGQFPTSCLDHIDRNKSNNRLTNLREATVAQNAYNTGLKSNNTSGVKGVSFEQARGLWLVLISYGGRRKNLGRYETLGEAQLVYDTAALKHHGAFAHTLAPIASPPSPTHSRSPPND